MWAAVMGTVATGAWANVSLLNASFEDPFVDPTAFATPEIPDWEETALPSSGGDQLNGIFTNLTGINTISNVDGGQAAFLAAVPASDNIAIWQVSTDTFQPGVTYNASALLGKTSDTQFSSPPPDNASLQMRLFYQPAGDPSRSLDDAFLVDSATITAGTLESLMLKSAQVSSGQVQAADFWAGHAIGIAFVSTNGNAFDPADRQSFTIDRVVITPEPTSLALVALGGVALLRRRLH